MFLHLCVSYSVHKGGVCLWSGQTPPLGRHPPFAVHAGYGQQAGGTHPTGMHSCFSKKVISLATDIGDALNTLAPPPSHLRTKLLLTTCRFFGGFFGKSAKSFPQTKIWRILDQPLLSIFEFVATESQGCARFTESWMFCISR